MEEAGVAIALVTTIDGLTLTNNLDGSVYVIDPNNWNNLVSLYVASGEYQKALDTLQSWAEAIPASSANALKKYNEITSLMNENNNQE